MRTRVIAECRGGTPKATSRRRAAFTLVELLVVVAIIALLISVLLPALRAARQQAKRSVCLANVQQLLKGWGFYLDDNQEFFLQGINVNYNYGGAQARTQMPWPPLSATDPIPKPLNKYLQLDPLIGSEYAGVFRCPADVGVAEARPTHYLHYGVSYLTNLMVVGQDQYGVDPTAPMPLKLVLYKMNAQLKKLNVSRVTTSPAELMLLADATWWYAWSQGATPEFTWHDRRAWHNTGFLDGHAKCTRFRKRIYKTEDYTLIPFRDLAGEAAALQTVLPDD